MSTVIAVLGLIGVLGFSAIGTWIVLWWALSGPSERDRIVREAHERAVRARVEDAQALAARDEAEFQAGRARLWAAVQDALNDQPQGEK